MATGQNNVLYQDILALSTKAPKQRRFSHRVLLHVNNSPIVATALIGDEITRNYLSSYGDVRRIEVSVKVLEYIKDIYPARNNVFITIIKQEVDDVTGIEVVGSKTTHDTFIGIVENPHDVIAIAGGNVKTDKELDSIGFINLAISIRPKAVTTTERFYYSSCINNTPVIDFWRYVMAKPEGVTGVSIVPPTGEEVYNNLLIPPGISLIELPRWIHEYEQGIYTSGVNNYIQDSQWYIFPKYDLDRWGSANESTLLVLAVPPTEVAMLPTTWFKHDDDYVVISSNGLTVVDNSEAMQHQQGNAIIGGRVTHLSDGPLEEQADGSQHHIAENNRTAVMLDNATTDQPVPIQQRKTTNNLALQLSHLSSAIWTEGTFQWDHSSPDIIYPGMPIRVLVPSGNKILSYTGIVAGTVTHSGKTETGTVNHAHVCSTTVTALLKRIDAQADPDK